MNFAIAECCQNWGLSKIKIGLWGAGLVGKIIASHIPNDIVAFIDNDKKKIGTKIEAIPVMSYEEFIQRFPKHYILITPYENQGIIDFLDSQNNARYFVGTDLPGEWHLFNPRQEYFDYISKIIDKEKTWAIYGCNYHSIRLFEFIRNKTDKEGFIICPSNVNKEITLLLHKDFGLKILEESKAKEMNLDIVYIATNDYKKNTFSCKEIEMWDCMKKITAYHNPKIRCFKNKHKNERCFIIGNGPSLCMEDLNVLHKNGELSFGVNSIFKSYEKTVWRPDYYISEDVLYLFNSGWKLLDFVKPREKAFITDKLPYSCYKNMPSEVEILHSQKNVLLNNLPKFSEDVSMGIYYAGTVIYSCLQMAVYMGFSEIYLLGVDFTGGANTGIHMYRHFYDNEKNVDRLWNYIVYLGYKAAKKYTEKHGIKIYNATRGGELEVFERVNFDNLFNEKKYLLS